MTTNHYINDDSDNGNDNVGSLHCKDVIIISDEENRDEICPWYSIKVDECTSSFLTEVEHDFWASRRQ